MFESVAENELVKEDFGGMAWCRDVPDRVEGSSAAKLQRKERTATSRRIGCNDR